MENFIDSLPFAIFHYCLLALVTATVVYLFFKKPPMSASFAVKVVLCSIGIVYLISGVLLRQCSKEKLSFMLKYV